MSGLCSTDSQTAAVKRPARPAALFVGFIAAHLRNEFLTRASLLRSEPSCCRFCPGNTCFFVGFSPHGHDVWLHWHDPPPTSAPAPPQMEQNTKRKDAVLSLSKRPRNSLTPWIFFNNSLFLSLSLCPPQTSPTAPPSARRMTLREATWRRGSSAPLPHLPHLRGRCRPTRLPPSRARGPPAPGPPARAPPLPPP